ncbi:unnamed protein product [Tuber aestivum]|uniref:Uncharacterized protein n=1 Tax=Tuber aestivum TaxID=59557 RepID=A0A292Q823_9PEZI|nr:unnamed protein product [Tuber aestivum]
MAFPRSALRNTYFYDATDPEVVLGGFRQNGSVTEANFLSFLDILLVTQGGTVRVQARISGHIVTRTNVPLATGAYDIYCDGRIEISNEPSVHRLFSRSVSGKETRFRDEIRARDRKCVISGMINDDISIQAHDWISFEAAHLFPLLGESIWIELDYGRWITDMDDSLQSSKIDSAQNGFLLRSHVHQKFDQYLISVNPDDGYKVVVFNCDVDGLDGRILDPVCRDPANPHCVSDQLLRWHFRQSVLANMRGPGEPIFEHDFPPGTDIVGEILAGPYGQERFELEMAARLRGVC